MNLRLIRIMLAVPLVLLLAAGTTVIALRDPVAVQVPVRIAEAADTASPEATPAASIEVTVPIAAPVIAPVPPAPDDPVIPVAEPVVSAPIEQGVDYHKLTSDLEQAASALERFNRKLMLVLTPPEVEDDTAQDVAADTATATEEEPKP